jgi:hypothetical protein
VAFAPSPATSDGGLIGLARAQEHLVLTVRAGIDGRDKVQQVAIGDRAPGQRRDLAALPAGGGASGLVVLDDGRIVVTLAEQDALLVIEADASASRTVLLESSPGPVDVEVDGDSLLIAHRLEGDAGGITRRSLGSL